ncbi:MAG: tRNA guanosine(34) transglycosylase Tgt [Alphaproteobacteria bacterium]
MSSKFSFSFTRPSGGKARRGKITTPHGSIETPAFIFCATKATVKSLTIEQVKTANTQIILSNTYHLMLQPGAELVEKMGGLHKFCGWDGPMLTDSGGFQIFSLGHGSVADEIKGKRSVKRETSMVKITEDGARFRSYIDGAYHMLTPEKSIDVQQKLGADLIVVLDECTPFHVDKSYTARSMDRSHRWALRSLAEFNRKDKGTQSLYGIIQGGIYEDLRQGGIDFVNSQPFFGHAIGGSLGGTKEQMESIVSFITPKLDENRPIHLLGIGGVQDIFMGVQQGIDTFDCVHPTRIARHGGALVKGGAHEHMQIRNARYKDDPNPLESDCGCYACIHHSRAYIHHLFKAKEILGLQLLSVHNLYFMNALLADIRYGIDTGTLSEMQRKWVGIADSL